MCREKSGILGFRCPHPIAGVVDSTNSSEPIKVETRGMEHGHIPKPASRAPGNVHEPAPGTDRSATGRPAAGVPSQGPSTGTPATGGPFTEPSTRAPTIGRLHQGQLYYSGLK